MHILVGRLRTSEGMSMKTIHPQRTSKMSAEEQALVARRIVEDNPQYHLIYEHILKGPVAHGRWDDHAKLTTYRLK